MCLTMTLKVKKILGKTARMEDGRIVRLDGVEEAAVGDYLDVYADLAMGKREATEVGSIRNIRKQGGKQS